MKNHVIEIQVVRIAGQVAEHDEFNDVGIVVPPALTNLQNGDIVTFHYNVDQSGGATKTIDIKFSMPWFGGGVREMVLDFEVPQAKTVEGVQSGKVMRIWYRAFCNSIGEMAVGNSPPEMTLGP
jgi:hypothetical protein